MMTHRKMECVIDDGKCVTAHFSPVTHFPFGDASMTAFLAKRHFNFDSLSSALAPMSDVMTYFLFNSNQ